MMVSNFSNKALDSVQNLALAEQDQADLDPEDTVFGVAVALWPSQWKTRATS